MMGHREKFKSALEYDVVYRREMYCYLQNHKHLIKFAKNQMNRRSRYAAKRDLNGVD